MRKWLIVLAVVFATSVGIAPTIAATKSPTKPKMHCKMVKKCTPVKKHVSSARHYPVKKKAIPAKKGSGPVCPTPVINVPQAAPPTVNVPDQPAPVVNVAAPPPSIGITVDDCSIYIVRENQLTVLDKITFCKKKTVSLD